MSFRLFGSLLALCVPALALAQAVITITPTVGANTPTTLGFERCEEQADTDITLYTVAVATPPLVGTLTIKLGSGDCSDETKCLTIANAVTVAASTTVTLNPTEIIGAIDQLDCLSSGGAGIEEKLTLFVEVIDTSVTPPVSIKKQTDDDDSLFIDTIKPAAALDSSASGGEGVLNVSWKTNADNDEDNDFPLEQEANFRLECKRTDVVEEFTGCGTTSGSTGIDGTFKSKVDKVNNTNLENGVSIDVQIITIDLAGNESLPTETFVGIPQDVLDFGENFNGAEQGGCAVGHGEGQLLWVGFLIVVISLLRRNKNEAQI
jgi:hypothetical protein